LKHRSIELREKPTAHFRDHMIAAPLKQPRFNRVDGGFVLFPRSHDRGPIELGE
jgi:hypothetical protein